MSAEKTVKAASGRADRSIRRLFAMRSGVQAMIDAMQATGESDTGGEFFDRLLDRLDDLDHRLLGKRPHDMAELRLQASVVRDVLDMQYPESENLGSDIVLAKRLVSNLVGMP